MFAFGIVRSNSGTFEAVAEPALKRYIEGDTAVVVREGAASIASGYNSILDECVASFTDLEAVVLMHQDVELTSPDFFGQVRDRLRDPSVGLIGTIGAQNVRSMAYWRGKIVGYVAESELVRDFGRGCYDVDAIDGMIMVIGPRAFAKIQFDEVVCPGFHGYDIDYSFAVRAEGLRVLVDPLPIIHHTKGGYGDRTMYVRTSRLWRRKWLTDAPMKTKLDSWRDEIGVLSHRDELALRSRLRGIGRRPNTMTRN